MGAVTQFTTAQWICKHETLLKCARFSDAVLEMWATKYSLHFLCMKEVSHGVIVVKILSWGLSSFSTIQSCDVASRVHFLAILKVSSFKHSGDMEGSQNSKIGSRDPRDPYWPNFSFLLLVPLGVHLRAKYAVSSFKHSRDMEGSKIN